MSHPIFSDDMAEIVDSFVVETQEIFDHLNNDLLKLETDGAEKELINRIFRGVHTVKGTAGFLNFDQFAELGHEFENVLNRLRREELQFRPAMMDTLFEAFDVMRELLQQVIDRDLQAIDLAHVISQLEAIQKSGEPEESVSTASHTDDREEPEMALSGVESADAGSRRGMEIDEAGSGLPGAATADALVTKKAAAGVGVESTIRVDVKRLDNLMNLVGELVLGRNRLSQISMLALEAGGEVDILRELSDTTTQIDYITSELQAAVMKTRMVQIKRVFTKFPRLVRDISREFGKEMNLVLEGEETELDRSIIEEISDPLLHLVRNAADHGIESADDRRAAGKPACGTIKLRACHEGNHIAIEIEDDGRGLDLEKIKKKAVERELITTQEAHDISDAEAYNLIFIPGFSTAERISNVSGRGVGMDVVRTNIMRLNGSINIQSEVGAGSKFALKLPLTLAIIHGLIVKVGKETFAIPLHSVEEVVGISDSDCYTLKGREVIRLRERILPLVRLARLFKVPGVRSNGHFNVVVVGAGQHAFGLVVDELIGQKEIVIKSLGAYLKTMPGIAGSTILGDGRVILILDVGEMVKLVQSARFEPHHDN